jgi:hypothetical protein
MSGSVHKYYSTAVILIIGIATKPSKNTLERYVRVKRPWQKYDEEEE